MVRLERTSGRLTCSGPCTPLCYTVTTFAGCCINTCSTEAFELVVQKGFCNYFFFFWSQLMISASTVLCSCRPSYRSREYEQRLCMQAHQTRRRSGVRMCACSRKAAHGHVGRRGLLTDRKQEEKALQQQRGSGKSQGWYKVQNVSSRNTGGVVGARVGLSFACSSPAKSKGRCDAFARTSQTICQCNWWEGSAHPGFVPFVRRRTAKQHKQVARCEVACKREGARQNVDVPRN